MYGLCLLQDSRSVSATMGLQFKRLLVGQKRYESCERISDRNAKMWKIITRLERGTCSCVPSTNACTSGAISNAAEDEKTQREQAGLSLLTRLYCRLLVLVSLFFGAVDIKSATSDERRGEAHARARAVAGGHQS